MPPTRPRCELWHFLRFTLRVFLPRDAGNNNNRGDDDGDYDDQDAPCNVSFPTTTPTTVPSRFWACMEATHP